MSVDEQLTDQFYQLQVQAECCRATEYCAAVRIQAWFRGIRLRAYLRHVCECVVMIQKHWRGYQAKIYASRLRKLRLHYMRYGHYTMQVTKIQKVWRGYWSRKNLFDFAARKRFFECLRQKNERVRAQLAGLCEQQKEEQQMREYAAMDRSCDVYAYRNHHLVSTIQQPGIYNSPYNLCKTDMERRMRRVKVPVTRKIYCAAPETMTVSPLPPVCDKPQGPFRTPCEVQCQRYRPLDPTLRCTAKYDALTDMQQHMKDEDWVKQITDEMFELYSQPYTRRYERLLSSSRRLIPEGAVSFRQYNPCKWTACQDFNLTLPPIPVFDKFNKTYSKTGQI